ncbi:ATP-dependent helicase [Syntrophobacteraceae bacterium DRH4]|nr:ATP-dependent helicase [Desulfoferrobacter suflitae]
MKQVGDLAPRILTADHQRVLAITRMHGSRRRLQTNLSEHCPSIPCSITTIDGFALSILNRWRRSFGYTRPIQPAGDAVFQETVFGTDASFEEILIKSTELLRSRTVKAVIRESYPIVMIDELQDCHGRLLEFVKALSSCSTLIVAADEFQLLDSNVPGCPAVEWLRGMEEGSGCRCKELTRCRRTAVQKILAAAECLRSNIAAEGETIPVICCPDYGPAAYKIIDVLVFNARSWHGSTAIITPSHDGFINEVLASLDCQLEKRNLKRISWFHEVGAREERKRLHHCLGVGCEAPGSTGWTAPIEELTPAASQIVARTQRFARLRGLQDISHCMVARHIDSVVHERRAYCGHSQKRVVTTVHGAKNREFDNVIIIWPYRVTSDSEQKRRLLYNAITRSKRNCMLLVRGDSKRVQKDPVLSLLGPAKPAFLPRPKKKAASGGKRK